MDKKQALKIFNYLDTLIDSPKSELNYSNNFELLIAVMLSARCTDKRVNLVTSKLFSLYNTPEKLANVSQQELEKLIYSVGFYKQKSKNIISACNDIVTRFNGQVPNNFKELTSLAGVGRKTANVMLIVGFNTPAIPVDTHVFRVSNRLGLTNAKTPIECEQQLSKLYSPQYYAKLHHLLVLFGRYYCRASDKQCNLDYLIDLVNTKINKKG